MKLSEDQISILKTEASKGLQLNGLQKIIQDDFGLKVTFMETRFLISDLGIEISAPNDKKADKQKEDNPDKSAEPLDADMQDSDTDSQDPADAQPGVKINVNQVQQPGALASGSVKWSDGETGEWLIDEMGSLDMRMATAGYQPTNEDIESFQTQLRQLLSA